ncbi:MAG TPA: 50S ribosomal protein L11 methyltransferase [Pirellulales bacterium]|jgi:predicted nicotinamide N-methyase|nr:50S ribosomal protein L11 methyltransferase [Pirellulales bacterium]
MSNDAQTLAAAVLTLPAVPGGWATKVVALGAHSIRLTSPRDPDAFLDDPDVNSEHARSGYMPYWGYIWPAAWDMAQEIVEYSWPAIGRDALEIGAGVGLIGLAALAAGLKVTFSDYDPQAVAAALYNARQNGWAEAVGLVLDWRQPLNRKFPLVFGGDVIYERANHQPILNLLDAMLADDGACWLADPGRGRTEAFVMLACRRGYRVENRPLPQYPLPQRKHEVTDLWVLTKSARLRAP